MYLYIFCIRQIISPKNGGFWRIFDKTGVFLLILLSGGGFFFETKFIKIKNKSQYKNISDGTH